MDALDWVLWVNVAVSSVVVANYIHGALKRRRR